MKNNLLLITSLLLVSGLALAFAGDETPPASTTQQETPIFHRGGNEVELLAGSFFSMGNSLPTQPPLGYAFQTVRYGWMLDDVHGSNFLRGNDEVLLAAFGGEVFTGPGTWLSGGELILRHNFVLEGSRFVPYVQIGGGGLDNDIYHNQTQQRIGEAFEFTAHGGLGVRWMINHNWAVSAEGEFRHVSDADLASRNGGLDSLGINLGLNFLF